MSFAYRVFGNHYIKICSGIIELEEAINKINQLKESENSI